MEADLCVRQCLTNYQHSCNPRPPGVPQMTASLPQGYSTRIFTVLTERPPPLALLLLEIRRSIFSTPSFTIISQHCLQLKFMSQKAISRAISRGDRLFYESSISCERARGVHFSPSAAAPKAERTANRDDHLRYRIYYFLSPYLFFSFFSCPGPPLTAKATLSLKVEVGLVDNQEYFDLTITCS